MPPDSYYYSETFPEQENAIPCFFPVDNDRVYWCAVDMDSTIDLTVAVHRAVGLIQDPVINNEVKRMGSMRNNQIKLELTALMKKVPENIVTIISHCMKPKLDESFFALFFEKFNFLKDCLWIEESRSGYHFYVFLNEGFSIQEAKSLANKIGLYVQQIQPLLAECILYPQGTDGNSYFLKNTNDVVLAGNKILNKNEINELSITLTADEHVADIIHPGPTLNYHPPYCMTHLADFYHQFPEIYRHHNGHMLRIFFANHLLACGIDIHAALRFFKMFTDYNEAKTLYYLEHLKDRNFKPPSCKTLQEYMGPICSYCHENQFVVREQKYDQLFIPGRFFFKKYTRAGFTTYILKKCITEHKKLLIVEPTHRIDEVVSKVRELLKGDFSFLHLRPNVEVCQIAKDLSLVSGLKNVPKGNCFKCKISEEDCEYKRIQSRLINNNFDVCYCTYHKFALSNLEEHSFDVVFFDEFTTAENLIKNINCVDVPDIPELSNKRLNGISKFIRSRFRELRKMHNGSYHDFGTLDNAQNKEITELLIYLKQASEDYCKIILDWMPFFSGPVYRYANEFYSFELFSRFLLQMRSINAEYVIGTDTIIPLFANNDFTIKSLRDPFDTDEKFVFLKKQGTGIEQKYYEIQKNKSATCDYFRSDKSRGIALKYEAPIYLSSSSFRPMQSVEVYLKYLGSLGLLPDKINKKEIHIQDAVNQIYQSISRFKTPFFGDQIIYVYYDEELQDLINELRKMIRKE